MIRFPIALVGALTLPVVAQDLSFVVDQDGSSVSATTAILAQSTGTLIGDHDPVDNPGGTQTRPGFFGGSGNNPIPLTLDVLSTTEMNTAPTGAFDLAIDTGGLTFNITGLSLDLIAGGGATSGFDVSLAWETFNTVNPTFIYLGGIPLTLPLAETELTTLTATQTSPALPGVLAAAGPDTFTMAGAVPVSLTLAADSATLPIPETSFDALLPITGTLTINPDDSAAVSLVFDLAGLSQDVDLSATPPLADLPFQLPTLDVETASVLMTVQFASVSLDAFGAINLIANSQDLNCSAADLAEPFGTLDFTDVITFLTLFSSNDPGADLAEPIGVFDFTDIVAFLTAFGAGCP